MAKKRKKKNGGKGDGGYGAGWGAMPPPGWPGADAAGGWGHGAHADHGAAGGLLGAVPGLPAFMRTRNAEQFLLGLAVGAGAAWMLADEKRRKAIIKSLMGVYSGLAGSWAELKEQMGDIQAEVQAAQHTEQ